MAAALPANCVWIIPGYLGVCNGPPLPVPGPDLPPIDIPEVGPDLPPVDLPGSDAAPETGADVEAQSEAGTREDVCTEGCWNCIAAEAGTVFHRSYSPSARTQRDGYAYQARVIRAYGVERFFPHNPTSGDIYEWTFSGVTFDGLVPFTCHLLEAKYDHSSWFRDDFSDGGRPTVRDRFVETVLLPKILDEALRQYGAVQPHHPDVTLTWVFSSLIFKIFMVEWFLSPLSPPDMSVVVETRHMP